MHHKNKSVYILGKGGMARETATIYEDLHRKKEVQGFIEQNKFNMDSLDKRCLLISAIGNPMKKYWINQLEKKGFSFDTVIHPSAIIDKSAKIRHGSIITADVVISIDVKIDKHVIINLNSSINHDCSVGPYTFIGPGVNIAGNVSIGESSWIGIGTTIIHKISIGRNCFIGAGAVVTRDIPDNTLAYGVPAKPIRKIIDKDWLKLI